MPSSRTELTTPERAALLILLAEGRALTSTELQDLGVRITGAPRRRLNEQGLVTSSKLGRGLVHEITDAGAARCRDELTAAPPPRAGSLGAALYAVLRGLARSGLAFDRIFPVAESPAPVEPLSVSVSVEGRIREAYRAAATGEGGYVGLVDLRGRLDDLDRSDVDAALGRLAGAKGVFLDAEPDQGSLSAAERAAAVRVGGEDRHMIMIEAG